MKKVQFEKAMLVCVGFVVFRLIVPWYADPDGPYFIKEYFNEVLYLLPFLFLILFAYIIKRNRETGLLISISCLFINEFFVVGEYFGVRAASLSEGSVFTLEKGDVFYLCLNLGIFIFLLIVSIVVLRQRKYEIIRLLFFIYVAISFTNILVALKYAFFKNENVFSIAKQDRNNTELTDSTSTIADSTYIDNRPTDSSNHSSGDPTAPSTILDTFQKTQVDSGNLRMSDSLPPQ